MTTTLDIPAPEAQLVLDLTEHERIEFRKCEQVIEENLHIFLKVGAALVNIRDSRLYRETHSSFESYLAERWDMSKTSAYRLIKASEVTAQLIVSPIGDTGIKQEILPQNEAQTRPLSLLSEEQRPWAWQQAVEAAGGQPTAAQVQAVVDEMLPPKPAEKPEAPALFEDEEVAQEVSYSLPGPTVAGTEASIERPDNMTDEEWESSVKPPTAAQALADLNTNRDAAVEQWEQDADADTAGPLPTAATPSPDTDTLGTASETIDAVKVDSGPSLVTPKSTSAAPKTTAAPAPPSLPPGWTTAMLKVEDYEKAQEMGLWPLSSAIEEVKALTLTIQELQQKVDSLESGQLPIQGVIQNQEIQTSPAMALAAGAATQLAGMMDKADVLTTGDVQIMDELFPTRETTLPEHIVAVLMTKRLRQVCGDTQIF